MKVEQLFNDLLTPGYHYTPRSNKTGHILAAALNSTAAAGAQVEAPARDNRKAITFSAVLVQPISCPRNVVADAPKKIRARLLPWSLTGMQRETISAACARRL